MGPKGLVIAIDGPAGSGKSTVAKALARRLHYLYIDSGAMYRCVTLAALRAHIEFTDSAALAALAEASEIRLEPGETGLRVFLNGEEVENLLRTPDISRRTSQFTANSSGVRAALVSQQREMGRSGGVVMEGRDIGTVVFPDADQKIYFDVSVDERARRRIHDYASRSIRHEPSDVLAEIERRDAEDRGRPLGSLRRAHDAALVQGDGKSVEAILDEIMALLPPDVARP